MLTYEEMQYFAAFAEYGTLTEVAEKFHISQPTITRAMKKAEDVFGVALFDRTKNSIRLNDNGTHAAQEITTLLKQTDEMIARVRAFDRASRTIAIGSAAALELPDLIGTISHLFPQKSITTELVLPKDLLQGLREGVYQLVILPGDLGQEVVEREKLATCWIGEEHLMFYLPKDHPLADRPSLTLADLNGEDMLLFSEIGFWGDLVRKKMPDSRFLMQSERYTFSELIANSVLPCFTTDLSLKYYGNALQDRIAVPITDPEVNITYYLACRAQDKRTYAPLFRQLEKRK